jgi:hypothetical protein
VSDLSNLSSLSKLEDLIFPNKAQQKVDAAAESRKEKQDIGIPVTSLVTQVHRVGSKSLEGISEPMLDIPIDPAILNDVSSGTLLILTDSTVIPGKPLLKLASSVR